MSGLNWFDWFVILFVAALLYCITHWPEETPKHPFTQDWKDE